MAKTLHFALDVFFLLVIVGFTGWVFFRSLKRSEDPRKLIFKWLFTITLVAGEVFFARHLVGSLHEGGPLGNFAQTFTLVISIAVVCIVMAITWRHNLADLVANPIASFYDGGREQVEPKPYYSIAKARRNRNKPLEAIMTIREQLAKFPNDFEGVLLLANIQTENLNDLPGAEITLNNFCNSPNVPDRQVVAALTQLADWHLKKSVDVDAARVALQRIVDRFPDTEAALHARQRLAHLGGVEKILLEQHDRQAMTVPEGVDNIGLLDSTEFLQPQEIEPGKLAAAYVKQLAAHPDDSEAREKLAVIYARNFKRLDLATLELAQLINEPRHSPRQIAGWLNQLASFQVELGADAETVTATLQKIVERYPHLPAADLARRRLARVRLEIKGQQGTIGVKFGVYEQNIGLKYGAPRKQ